MRNEIITAIKEVADKQKINIKFDDVTLNKPFKEIGIDSINVLGMIVDIEEKVGCRLEDAELNQIKTINQLIAIFESKKK